MSSRAKAFVGCQAYFCAGAAGSLRHLSRAAHHRRVGGPSYDRHAAGGRVRFLGGRPFRRALPRVLGTGWIPSPRLVLNAGLERICFSAYAPGSVAAIWSRGREPGRRARGL